MHFLRSLEAPPGSSLGCGSEAEADTDAHTTTKGAAADADANTRARRVIAGAISVRGITVAITIRRSDDAAGETGP